MKATKRWTSLAALMGAIGCAALVSASLLSAPRAAGADPSPGKVLRIFDVGGVLTADGTLWTYRPDRSRWMTIDEAFKDQGRDTHVLPLPVPAQSIEEMVTFGFLRTASGDCWLYQIDHDKWEKLPSPVR